jgi:pyruvate ferredoxin oxidoreductase gamma subunit
MLKGDCAGSDVPKSISRRSPGILNRNLAVKEESPLAEMLEIRWHGRGGQGAKTAALLLAEAAAAVGKYVQAFPEYGPERMGAPVVSYNRISSQPITIHSAVASPRYVVVLDPSFIGPIDFTAGMPPDGVLLINSSDAAGVLRKRLKLDSEEVKVYTLDASRISEEAIGRPIPNTPMLGAVVAAAKVMTIEELLEDTRKRLERKFRNRPELIDGNMTAISRAYQEVQSQ